MRPPRLSIYAHLAVLQKFRKRLHDDESAPENARLPLLIALYSRLYE